MPLRTVNEQPQPYPVVEQPPAEDIEDYMGFAFFVCLFCCWPVGICAIMSACRCQSAKAEGNYEEARSTSKATLTFNLVALVRGIVTLIAVLI